MRVRVRERFVWLNDRVGRLLLSRRAHYFLVAAPTTASRDDAQFLMKKLRQLKVSPRALILNSAFVPGNEWIEVLESAELESEDLRSVLATLKEERQIREQASNEVARSFSKRHPSLRQLKLPYVEVPEPRDVVMALSQQLGAAQLI